MPHTFADAACTRCALLCDDLRVTTDAGRVVAAERACRLAAPWLLAQSAAPPADPALFAANVARAADLLRAARAPLVTGLMRTTPGGLRAAAELADRLGATIDPAGASPAAALAFARAGESACTLGEVRHRADLIVFWGCDPARTHPRFFERFVDLPGRFAPGGRAGRVVVVVSGVATETDPLADQVVRVPGGWDALRALRLHVAGKGGDPAWKPLADRLTAAQFGVVFHGDGLVAGAARPAPVLEELAKLVAELNAGRRFYARRLKPGATSGAESLLAWQTGYPLAVNFAAGYPRSSPGEWSAPALLARGDADCVVLVGSEGLSAWPEAAKEMLGRLPVVRLDPPGAPEWPAAAVRFETAAPGVHAGGDMERLDGVTLPLRPLFPGGPPDDGEVLRAVLAGLRG